MPHFPWILLTCRLQGPDLRRRQVRWTVLLGLLLGLGWVARAAEISGRMTVAVLGFENRSGDPEARHWGSMAERYINSRLMAVESLRLVPVDFSRRELSLHVCDAVAPDQAQQAGRLVEARRVVWGNYERKGKKWVVRVRVMTVANGRTAKELRVAAEDWCEVLDRLLDRVLAELRVRPTKAELAEVHRPRTRSAVALEWHSRGLAALVLGGSRADAEAAFRKAVEADPLFCEAQEDLALALYDQGRLEAAAAAGAQAVQRNPNSSRGRRTLALVLAGEERFAEAEKEAQEAVRLDPENNLALTKLGLLCIPLEKLDQAAGFLRRALEVDPKDPRTHAALGLAHALRGRRAEAVADLSEAKRCHADQSDALLLIWQAYEALEETALAAEHLDRYVALARREGFQPTQVDAIEAYGREMKERLLPQEIAAPAPTSYTEETLTAALRRLLSPEEMEQVINLLAGTPEIHRWAEELARGTTNTLDRARRLFDALWRPNETGGFGVRTAREVFAAWENPNESFSCQEYAKLYIALARALGLQAFYVHLERDYAGEVVYHDCAAVFEGTRGWLVDPAYRWFGVPHKEYTILNDVQAIAHHLYQSADRAHSVACCEMAAKLHPETAWGQLHRVAALIAVQDYKRAAEGLATARQLEPGRWDSFFYEGILAAKMGRTESSIACLRQALELNPKCGSAHWAIGDQLRERGDLAGAQVEYRVALRCLLPPQVRETVLRSLSEVSEKLGD